MTMQPSKPTSRYEAMEHLRRGDDLSWRKDALFGLGLPLLALTFTVAASAAIVGFWRLIVSLVH